jgi:hypothetical protein
MLSRKLIVLPVLLCWACGSGSVPSEKLTNSKSALRAAEEAGAQQDPKSALHLKLAKDGVALAERQISNGDNDKAALTLDQAKADAELAIGLTHQYNERRAAEQARARIEALQAQAQ